MTRIQEKITRHFYWSRITGNIKRFCRIWRVCQTVDKLNQNIPVAPLYYIPASFVNYVGLLPQTKAGHKYMLTIMYSSTRFPKAILLRSISTKKIDDAPISFFTNVGFVRTIQADRGSNFTSKIFRQVTEQLGITYIRLSAYHLQLQEELERFHAFLKNMLGAYCTENHKEWNQ